MIEQLNIPTNDPAKAGQRASIYKVIFGPYSRYALYPVHSRFDSVVWFVDDAEQLDCLIADKPKVIRQELNWVDAIEGLWDGCYHITTN